MKASGIWIRTPAPSPESTSEPGGPSVFEVLQDREGVENRRVASRRPLKSATIPTPQASCSKEGS